MVLMYLLVPSAYVQTGERTILGGMGGTGRAVTAVSVVGDSVGAGSARTFRSAWLVCVRERVSRRKIHRFPKEEEQERRNVRGLACKHGQRRLAM